MLITLGYRIPREHLASLLGTVTAYPLTQEFHDAWASLPERPRYSALAFGLVAATGKPVRLFEEWHLGDKDRASGTKALLLTTDTALDYQLRIAVRAWERHIRGSGSHLLLADLLPEPEPTRSFSDFIEFRPNEVPLAPNWVFRAAAWQVARRLAARPLRIDGYRRPIALRMDTAGKLLVWEDLIDRDKTAYAMANVTVRLASRPGIEDLVLTFDGHVSRLDMTGKWFKNIWVKRGEDTPILELPAKPRKFDGEWRREFDPAIASILDSCDLTELKLPDQLPETPDVYRPRLSSSRYHAIGSGLGPRFMLRLHEHISRELREIVPLTYELDDSIKLPERVEKYPKGGVLPDAIGPTGYKKLTIACMYRTPGARDRMLDELEELTGCRPAGDGSPIAVHERLSLIAVWCPELLDHATVNRAEHLESLNLATDDDHLIAAWAETEFHPAVEPPEFDAKPHLRRLFGHLRIPVQFLATEPTVLPKGARRSSTDTKKHAARSALRDLLRAAGVLDDRMRNAVAADKIRNRLDRRTLLVGINTRSQNIKGTERPMVLMMTAVLADPDDLDQWRVTMYSDRQSRWVRMAEGVTDFHASGIGSTFLGRTEEKAEITRAEVERRLRDLVSEDLRNTPVVLFVDAQATRTIWPGLQNVRFDAGPLPGDTLRAGGDDVAVVRVQGDMAALGRPVTRVDEGRMPDDKLQPAAPGKGVYRLVESAVPSWLFAGKSRSLEGKDGRVGAQYTRWTLPQELQGELRKPWHSYTAREIVVVRSGLWQPEELAALAARLCEQPIAWDGRTLVPGPLHLGITADKDHPDYRKFEQDVE